MLKKIIVILVLLLAVVNSTSKDSVEKEFGFIKMETAGFHKPNSVAAYHILPQRCHIVERGTEWTQVQLHDGTVAYIPSEVLR